MKKIAKWLTAAAMAVAFVGTVSAQEPRRGGAQPPGGRGGFQGGMGFGGGTTVYALLSTNKDLQTELKITDEQKTKLAEVAKDQQAKMREAFTGGGIGRDATDEQRKEFAEKMAKLAAEGKKAYEGVLTADQAKRTTQINYQYMGIRAFSDKDVQTGMKFSDEQKEKIKTITDKYNTDARELRGGGRGEGGGGGAGRSQPSEENRKKLDALTKDTEEKIVAVLTDDQKKSWKDMIGEKFDVSKLRVAPARPRDN